MPAESHGPSAPWRPCFSRRGVEILQRALDATVAPRWIVRGHPHNERRDLPHRPGTAGPLRRERPLPGDQAPVPAQDRVRCHDGRDLPQDPTTEWLALRRETSALVVGQPDAPPLQLLPKDAVLLHEVLDDLLLVAVDPSSEGHEQ